MVMKTINKTIEVKAYLDDNNNPCCAKNFDTGEVCMFYRTQRFGMHETCVFAKEETKYLEKLVRRDNGKGTLIPLEDCPLWK